MPTAFIDYDGTLHNSMCVYGPAFRAGHALMVERGQAQPRTFSDDEIARWLGFTVEDMWAEFMPELPEEIWRDVSLYVGSEMDRLTDKGEARLYDGTLETLRALKDAGWTLVFLSNCGPGYRDKHFAAFGLGEVFDAAYCAADFPGLAKWQIYERVESDFPKPHVMVGDRFHDLEVATRAGIASVGCAYGYGAPDELASATAVINDIRDLPDALRAIEQ